jgi:hypothetical protein
MTQLRDGDYEQLLPHPYVLLRTPFGYDAKIHTDLAPIVQACWARGILTTQSFQGWSDDGYAYLTFLSEHHAHQFLAALGLTERDDSNVMLTRIHGAGGQVANVMFPPSHIPVLARALASEAPTTPTVNSATHTATHTR